MKPSAKPAAKKYQLDKTQLPPGTDVVHYIFPIDVNGRKTQEIPVAELESNPARYASMFPQYFKQINAPQAPVIKPVSKEYAVKGGKLVKTKPRRTVADIDTNQPTAPVTAARTIKPAVAEKPATELPLNSAAETADKRNRKG